MDWLLRLQDAPRDGEVARQFEVWRSRSPAHDRAWARARRSWQLIGAVPLAYEHLWNEGQAGAHGPAAGDGRVSGARRRRRAGWKEWTAGSVAIAAFAMFLAFAMPAIMLRLEADYVTATAESREITLEDGSVVTLGADSAVAARMDHNMRRIILLSGEAFFEVTPDSSRPFVVASGGVDVTAFGTAFNVQLSTVATTVELARGSVGVSWDRAALHDDTSLSPGEMVVVDRHTGAMVKNSIAQHDVAAWRNGRLFVNDATIGSVVEQLRRYHPAWISLPDYRLAARRVTGLYDLRDPDRALRALVQPYEGHVREISPYLRVVSGF